jgi:hypothetical protein
LEAGAGYAFVSISGDEYTDDYSVGSIGFHATPTFGFYLSPKISLSAFAKTQSFGSFTSGKITRDKDDKKTLYPLQDKEEDIKFSFDKATGSKISEKISGLSFGAALNFSF